MPAFSFKDRYVDAVVSGVKTTTIRKNHRGDPGDIAYLFARGRTKNCLRIGEYPLISVERFRITIEDYSPVFWVKETKIPIHTTEAAELARRDGFRNQQDLALFFSSEHGLPFSGFIYRWERVLPSRYFLQPAPPRYLGWEVQDVAYEKGCRWFGSYNVARDSIVDARPNWVIPKAISRDFIKSLPDAYSRSLSQEFKKIPDRIKIYF